MTSSNLVGFICGTKGDSISFLVNKDVSLSFGQIVRIDSGERCFYARVVNSESSSTLDTIAQLREAEGKEAFGPYSAYRSVDAILFLEKRTGKLRSPTFNPNYRDKVYAASEEDCSILKLSGELEVGRLRSEDQLLGSVGINIEAIPRMMGMFGMTGSGKTNTELILNAHIIDNSPQTVALIFDFAGQLLEGKEIKPQRGLKDHPLFHSKVQYYSARDGKMAVGLHTITPAKLDTLFPDIQPPQKRLAWALYKHFGAEWIERAQETYRAEGNIGIRVQKIVVEALMQKLLSLPHDLFPASNYTFIDSALQNICKGVTCLVDISGLRSEDQTRVVCLLASAIAEHYKRVGLNAVTPRPSRINFDVFAELWTKVIMKTELKKDRLYLTENTPYMEYSETEIKMLDVGEALLISEPKIKFAVPIKVAHYPEYLDKRGKADYGLPDSPRLSEMDDRLKQLSGQGKLSLE